MKNISETSVISESSANRISGRRKGLPELLAPAGSRKAFLGAVKAGADAVYLGGEKFGARAYAENFTGEDIIRSVREAHILGKKVYLTLNVLTKESELEETVRFAEELYEEGLDGAIVQDIGVLARLHERCPGLALHASTQMSVTGPESVRFLKQLGVKRVVPARELSLEEIRILKEEEPIEVESFIHGAMCYAYSGRCLMSSFLGGRSGNRGRCAGTCRLPYRILDSDGQNIPLLKEKRAGGTGRNVPLSRGKGPKGAVQTDRVLTYPLSMRDMCVLEILPDLIDAGIDSFKIEGRMKSPHYAAGVSALYRKYIDRYVEWDAAGRKTPWKVEAEDMRRLRSLYLRTDLSTGYYYKRNGRDLLTITEPGYAGTDDSLLAKIEQKYLGDLPKREITGRALFVPGEPARLTVCAEGLPGNHGPACAGMQGSDRADLADTANKPDCGSCVQAEVTGEVVQEAQKRPMEAAEIEKRLRKTGDAYFTFTELKVEVSGDVFMPVASLNALRRDALMALEDKIIAQADAERQQVRNCATEGSNGSGSRASEERDGSGSRASEERDGSGSRANGIPAEAAPQKGPSVWAVVTTLPQLRAAQRCGIGNIVVEDTPQITKALTEAEQSGFYAALPYVMRRNSLDAVRRLIGGGYKGVLVRNLEELTLLKECGFAGRIIADSSLYQWNTKAREVLLRECDMVSLGWELSARDMQPLIEGAAERQILNVYGRIPMMITAGCVKKTAGVCSRTERGRAENSRTENSRTERGRAENRQADDRRAETDFFYVEDRKGIRFPVRCDCKYCGNVIYNSLPQSLHTFAARKDPVAMGAAVWLCFFTDESGDETEKVLRWYKAASYAGEAPDTAGVFSDYTTGHFKKSAL